MNKKNLKNKKAFSLIELSIVILIVGIIVAGITQSSRMIGAFKLSAARNITQSSPIYSIRDTVAWYETSMDGSIVDSEADDGLEVGTWNDINPFTTNGTRYNLAQTLTKRPLYKTNIMNGAPALLFDGSNDCLTLTPELTLERTQTIFVVFKPRVAADDGMILSTTSNNGGRYQVIRYIGSSNTLSTWNGAVHSAAITASTNARVVTFTQNNAAVQFYENGTAITGGNVNNEAYKFSQVGGLDVAPQTPFDGYIAEIILYSRVLKTEERQAIERYLGKKYNIVVV